MSKEKLSLLLNPDCYVPTATLTFLQVFGIEALEWDPVIVKKEVEEILGQSVSEANLDKINAGTAIIYSNVGEIYPQALETICHTSSGNFPDSDKWNPLELEELVQGLVDCTLLTNREYTPREECEKYIHVILSEAGFHKVPKSLAVLTNLGSEEIESAKNKDEAVQKEKEEALLEYITEIMRVRIEQLKPLEIKQ